MIVSNSCNNEAEAYENYAVNSSNCIRCHQCYTVCGFGAISYVDSMLTDANGNPFVNPLTGDTIFKRGVAKIDQKKCVGCGECFKVCPTHTIYQKGGNESEGYAYKITYSISTSACTRCLKCVKECPYGAISSTDDQVKTDPITGDPIIDPVTGDIAVTPGKVTIDASKCVGCGKCFAVCPFNAISKNKTTVATAGTKADGVTGASR